MMVATTVVSTQFAMTSHAGLFKIDFGSAENDRIPLDADGNPTMAPAPLKDWDVIGTWTFADPHGTGAPDGDGTTAIWKLKDFSKDADNDVTMTVMDNKALAEKINPDNPPYALGQIHNNPTKEGLGVGYDGVFVPAIVKDDYMYRNPDTAGAETLMRFAGLTPGFYNVTAY